MAQSDPIALPGFCLGAVSPSFWLIGVCPALVEFLARPASECSFSAAVFSGEFLAGEHYALLTSLEENTQYYGISFRSKKTKLALRFPITSNL